MLLELVFHTCLACFCSLNFLLQVPNSQRQNRHNRGRMNGRMPPQGGGHSLPYMQQSVTYSKDSFNQQVLLLSSHKYFLSALFHMLKICAFALFLYKIMMPMDFTILSGRQLSLKVLLSTSHKHSDILEKLTSWCTLFKMLY